MARRVADSVADDMTIFAKRLEVETPIFAQKLKTGIDAFTRALLISVTLNPNELDDAESAITGAGSFLVVLGETEPKLQNLSDVIAALPPMTKATNRAKKRLTKAMSEYVIEMRNAQTLVAETLRTLNGALGRAENLISAPC